MSGPAHESPLCYVREVLYAPDTPTTLLQITFGRVHSPVIRPASTLVQGGAFLWRVSTRARIHKVVGPLLHIQRLTLGVMPSTVSRWPSRSLQLLFAYFRPRPAQPPHPDLLVVKRIPFRPLNFQSGRYTLCHRSIPSLLTDTSIHFIPSKL